MIFHPLNYIKKEGSFVFSDSVSAIAHTCLNKPIFKEFWQNFSFQTSTLEISETDEYIFSLGNASRLALDGNEYSINIESAGICICAASETALIHGFVTLLDRFQALGDDKTASVTIDCCQLIDRPSIQNRMVHYCIFPETELWEIQRFVRFCGALKYTHIVLEFWGMLKYDCLKELSWEHAFTKEQIRPIVREATDLGIEIIPMFNHWGHASAGRVMHGKHVVLDQNPALQTYFSEDGWCWDIRKPKVKELLSQIRAELVELCGNGKYFHIGCDEAFNFDLTKKESMEMICDYINEISRELEQQGRETIIWGDMFLYYHKYYNPNNRYTCNAPLPECEKFMLDRLSKKIIIADWQYEAKEAPVETALVFKKAGFNCVLCPWDKGMAEVESCITTAKEEKFMGILHTTWHTLSSGMGYVLLAAVQGFENCRVLSKPSVRTYPAALMRKVMPINGEYKKAGWAKLEIDVKW